MRVPTGVEGFDVLVDGGLPEGACVVLQGPPGNEKDAFALQFLAQGLRAGEAAVVVVSSTAPEQFLESLSKYGVNVEEAIAGNRLKVVDWHSYQDETVAGVEERGHVFRCSVDLTNVGIALGRALGLLAPGVPRRGVLEVLSPALRLFEVDQVYAFAQSSKAKLARHRVTALFLLEKEMHDASVVSSVSQPFDGVIDIERKREGDAIVRKIGVLSLKDTVPDSEFHVLDMLAGKGLRIRAPRPQAPERKPEPAEPPAERAPPPVAAEPPKPSPSGAPLSNRATMILRIAEERIRIDPADADALFAKASALATMGDTQGAIAALDALSGLSDTYPGLWVLRANLFSRLGDRRGAVESRRRAVEIARREEQRARSGETVPCPLCEGLVPVDSHECPTCGARFLEEVGLAEELDSLGKAAVQDKIREEMKLEPATGRPLSKEPAAKPPAGRVVRKTAPPPTGPETKGRRGMTNGIRGRTNGLTNGIRGRTNGLTNGIRGRTNGLTNGIRGRTNGLTNGIRGRTNGLTNGIRGRTNGLTNGLVNGLASLRRGMTNGLTNGDGFTNGLGAARFRREASVNKWKLYVIPLLSVVLLLLPLLGPANLVTRAYPIAIDGDVSDWSPAAIAGQTRKVGVNPNVDIIRFGMADNVDYLAFFAEVNGSALRGGDLPPTMDTFHIFIDTDRNPSTGYRVDGLGADRLLEVSGWGGAVNVSSLSEWDVNRDALDWRGWIKAAAATAAVNGGRLETQVDWLALVSPKTGVSATLHARGYDGSTDTADYALNSGGGSLLVAEDPVVSETITGANAQLLRLDLSAFGGDVGVTGLTVTLTGSASVSAVSGLSLVDGVGTLVDRRIPVDRRVPFQFQERRVAPGTPLRLFVIAETAASNGDTLGALLAGPADVAAPGGAVTVRRLPSVRDVGYLGSVPAGPRIDGGFAEWTSVTPDPQGDVTGPVDPDIDLTGFAAQRAANDSFFLAQVGGRAMAGTWVPEANGLAPVTQAAPSDQDRDGVPDAVDPFPFDFNNDGTPDAQTGGDYDGDGILDYGQVGGTDLWLNTTIPATFPSPYANRDIRVYIGPQQEPLRSPDDVLRVFVDLDNSSWSGYSLGGIGADRMIEVSGTAGRVRAAALFTFTGSYPGVWSWLRSANVSFALGFDRLELAAPGNLTPSGSRLYVEIGGALGSVDTTSRSTRGTRGDPAGTPAVGKAHTSFDDASNPLPQTNPWDLVAAGTRASTLLDGNSNAISTLYNHQRKVVRAGDVPVDTACDATNSDGCWYAVFSDQLAEDLATTAASTETITKGSKVAGTFPTDIQSENAAYIQYRESTAFSTKVGAFNIGTGGLGTTVPVTGVGFQPKVVIFWWSGRTESTDTTNGANIARGFGVAVSATDRRAVYSQSQDAAGDMATDSGHHDAEAIGALTTAGAIDGLADLQSMDSDGFTLIIDDQFTIDLRVHYVALGGSDLTNAITGMLTESGATGDQDITALSFQPDAVLFFSAMIGADPPGTTADSSMMVGAAAGATPANAVWAGGSNDAAGTSQTISYSRAGESIALLSTGATSTNGRASVTEWLSSGFRLNWAEVTSSRRVHYLALKGGSYLVGDLLTQTDTTTTIVESGFGFSPKAGILISNGLSQSSLDTVAAGDEWSAGAFTSPTERGAQGTWDEDSLTTSETATGVEHDEVYVRISTTDTIDALMDIQSVDSGGFTAIMDNADTSQRFVWYLAFGGSSTMEVRYDWASVPSASAWTLKVKGYRQDENVLVQVLTAPSTWNTRITISATSNTLYTYSLSSAEYNSGSPAIRFVDANAAEDTLSDLWVDLAVVVSTNHWDRIVLMRSLDTSGSTWGSQIILASGRTGDSALLLARDSSEPSIAIDSGGFLHLVWVAASAAGDQATLNLVRYTKTTVAYPTQSELANSGNWDAVTSVDDTNTGYMPTVSTDTSNNPHVAWSGSKTSGTVYYKNKAAGTWRATVSWGTTYTGLSVDVSPQNNYVSLARYFETVDAEIAYRSNTGTNTVNSPKTRTWDGSTWGTETEQATAGSPIRAARMAWSPLSPDTRIFVTQSDDGWLDAYVCTPSCTATNDIGQVWSAAPGNPEKRFDIAYEQTSGDALLVYGVLSTNTARDIAYRTFIGGSWSAELYLDDTGHATDIQYSLINLASKKWSDQVGLIGGDDTNNHANAWIWDGTAWGSNTEIDASAQTPNREEMAIAWESSSGNLLAVAVDGGSQDQITWKEFTTSWSAASTQTCTSTGDILRWISLKPNPLSTANDMVMATGNDVPGLNTCYWTGSAWNTLVSQDTGIDSSAARAFDFAWESTGSKGILVYGTTGGQITYRTFTAPSTWGTATNVAMGANTHPWVQLRTNPSETNTVRVLGAVMEGTANDLGAIRWDGSTLTVIGASTFSADVGTTTYDSFELEDDDVGNTIQYTVCMNLASNQCDASSEFTKWDGTAGYDTVAAEVESASYPSLATTYESNGDLWVAYAKDVDGTTRAVYARALDYPSSGWQSTTTIDSLSGTLYTKPSIGIDVDNNVRALYVATAGPQLYYKARFGGSWGTRLAVDTTSDNPTIMVRGPNDATYGSLPGGLYWKSSASETYFFQIPEFQLVIIPVLAVLLFGIVRRRTGRRTDNQRPN